MAGRLIELGCPSDKLAIHHVGVDLASIESVPRRWDGRRSLQVLMAASFREKKGIPYGIAAIAELAKHLEVELTVIGDSDGRPSGETEKGRIRVAVQRAGLEHRVAFLGFQTHAELLRQAYQHDVFLAPSVTASDGDTEGTPVTLIEMLATGMPVVSSMHSDIPEIIPSRDFGILARERDVHDLVDALLSIADRAADWSAMAQRARSHLETHFDASVLGRQLAHHYRTFIRG
jgi:colanic acid/amylovoran biosynthesis glycosyltransferase